VEDNGNARHENTSENETTWHKIKVWLFIFTEVNFAASLIFYPPKSFSSINSKAKFQNVMFSVAYLT